MNKELYEEIVYIAKNIKKLIENPNMKVKRLSSIFKFYVITLLLLILYFLFCYCFGEKGSIFMIVFLLIVLIVCLKLFHYYKKLIKEQLEDAKNIKLKIDITNEGIKTIYSKYKNRVDFEDIKAIKINKYSILLIPKEYKEDNITYWNITQKEELIKELKKYNKLNLLVDNQCNLK